jgi:hypothetical protein
MIGKPLKRQYTVCNAMEQNMNQALIQMAKGENVTHDLAQLLTDED